MGLKQNTTILAQLPLRLRGGDPGTLRSMWGRTDLRNQSVGQGITSKTAGIPYGHYAPSSWNLPYTGGAISAFTFLGATFSASLLRGTPLDISGSVSVAFTSSTTVNATGNMQGSVTSFTPLSPESLAAAVWSALATDYNVANTMGNKLNLASSGGVDYNLLSQAVWTYSTRGLSSVGNQSVATEVNNTVTPAVWTYTLRSLTTVGNQAVAAEVANTVVPADVQYVNGIEVVGTGTAGDPWGPV